VVLLGVGEAGVGAIDDFGPQAAPALLVVGEELIGPGGGGLTNTHQAVQGQAEAGLAVGAATWVDLAQEVEMEQGPDLADRFAARRAGIEGLVEKGPESATE
jgi:hypothetical protein